MAIDWYRGEYEYKGGLIKAEAQRRGLAALAKGIEGAKDAYGRYREGGLRGVVDEEYAAEQKEARKEMPKLRAELGEEEPTAPDHSQDPWYRKALGALGPKEQIDPTDYARLKGRVAAEDTRTKRLRAVSPLLPYTKDPGAVLQKLDPKFNFGAGDLTLEHPRGEPKPEKPDDPYKHGIIGLAYARAKEKAGREPTSGEIEAERLRIIDEGLALKDKHENPVVPRDPKKWAYDIQRAYKVIEAERRAAGDTRPITEDEVRARVASWYPHGQPGDNDLSGVLGGKPPPQTNPQGAARSGAAAIPPGGGGDEQPESDPTHRDPDADPRTPTNRKNPDEPPHHNESRVNPKEGDKSNESDRRPGTSQKELPDTHYLDPDGSVDPGAPTAGNQDEDEDDPDAEYFQ